MNAIVILCDTLRRDHVGAYTGGRPLNECWSAEAPSWAVQPGWGNSAPLQLDVDARPMSLS